MKINSIALSGVLLASLCSQTAVARHPKALSPKKLHIAHSTGDWRTFHQEQLARQRAILLQPAKSTTAKTTATRSRIIGAAGRSYDEDLGAVVLNDTARLSYTGDRGGDLNDEQINFDEINFYEMYDGVLYAESKEKQTFDSRDNVITSTYQEWDDDLGALADVDKTFNTFTSFDKVLRDSTIRMEGTIWINSGRNYNTYDAAQNLIENIAFDWGGSEWYNYKSVYTYTAANKVATEYFMAKEATATDFDTLSRTLYTYDVADRLIKELYQSKMMGVFVNNDQRNYTYDASGRLIQEVNDFWDASGAAWVNIQNTINTYDGAGNKVKATNFRKEGSAVDSSYRYLYTYNTYGQATREIYQRWDEDPASWDALYQEDQAFYYEEYVTASVKQIPLAGSLKVYPIPAKDELYVTMLLDKAQAATITLVDMQGRLLSSRTITAAQTINETIALGNMASGNYFLSIIGDNGARITKQITVAH